MKYQIILESSRNIADDDFEKMVKPVLKLKGFTLTEARSLDGIREEAYSCEAMKKAVIKELGDWKKEHDQHFKHRRDALYKTREIARHPSEGPIIEMICPCGKSIIGFKNSIRNEASVKQTTKKRVKDPLDD